MADIIKIKAYDGTTTMDLKITLEKGSPLFRTHPDLVKGTEIEPLPLDAVADRAMNYAYLDGEEPNIKVIGSYVDIWTSSIVDILYLHRDNKLISIVDQSKVFDLLPTGSTMEIEGMYLTPFSMGGSGEPLLKINSAEVEDIKIDTTAPITVTYSLNHVPGGVSAISNGKPYGRRTVGGVAIYNRGIPVTIVVKLSGLVIADGDEKDFPILYPHNADSFRLRKAGKSKPQDLYFYV